MALRNWLLVGAALAGAALCACNHDQARLTLGPGYGLFYNDQGPTVALAYGLPNSDDVALMLQCAKGSGMVQVSDVARGKPAGAILLASAGRTTSVAVKPEAGESSGPGVLQGSTPLGAPALGGFRRSGVIEVAYAGVRYTITAAPAERPGVERFFGVCRKA